MADNVVSNAGSGGSTFGTDDIAGVHYPRNKIIIGADGTNDGDVSATNPLPVKGTGTAGTANSGVVTIQGIASMTAVQVADNGGSLTVDGTVAATQSGTWNITNVSGTVSLPTGAATAAKQPALGTAGTASADVITIQGIASMTAVKVDGSAVTQPVSAASLPLPSGAATAAKQPALGTAGTASSDVITIQGIASMTAVKVDGSAVTQPISAASLPLPSGAATETSLAKLTITQGTSLGSNTQVMVGGSVTTAAPSYTTGQISPLSLDTAGSVRANVTAQPARAATTDTITAKLATDTIQNGTTALTPKFAAISASSSGDNTIVSAVTSKKIRVLRFSLSSNGTVQAKWKSATAGDITGLFYMQQYGGAGAPFCPVGLFETTAGEALVLNLSGAVAVGGNLTYVEV